jgi:hypothetical protein
MTSASPRIPFIHTFHRKDCLLKHDFETLNFRLGVSGVVDVYLPIAVRLAGNLQQQARASGSMLFYAAVMVSNSP